MKLRIAIALSAALAVGSVTHAVEPKPGDKFDASNVDQIKDLISPGLEWCVKHGLPMTIVEYKPIEWPEAYKEATEKYSAQVKLAADGLTLENYVAGLPFPKIDPNDPEGRAEDHVELRVQDHADRRRRTSGTSTPTPARSTAAPRRCRSSATSCSITSAACATSAASTSIRSRPGRRTKGIQAKSSLHPILEPFDLKGVGGLSYRYIDPSKQDDTWLYLPSLRRVRRLSTAQRSDALFGQDTDVDCYYGYAGHIAWMEWKFLGEKKMLGVFHAKNFPVKWAAGGARLRVRRRLGEAQRLRRRGRVEARRSTRTASASSSSTRRRASSPTPTSTTAPASSGRSGSTSSASASSRSRGAKLSIYPDERAFLPSIVMVDMQLSHATKAALPSHRYPGEEGWYFNLGEKSGTTEDFFTIAHLISSGR